MNRMLTLLIAGVVALAFAAPSMAQEGKTLGVVDNGRTQIVFQAANTSDLPMQQLQAWSDFANQHPDIARQLAYKPSLINNESYANKHPELAQFFSQHSDIRDAMAENPGNFVAIPPRPGE